MAKKNMENGISITIMDASKWKMQKVTFIGENSRMASRKDLEHMRVLMERDTSGNI